MASRPRTIGLTGGIGSGKSTVAQMFRDLGAEVLDADQIARAVVQPGQPAHAEIIEHFGDEMLAPNGGIDRKRLGAKVFADEAARRSLEQITHPRIAAEAERQILAAGTRGIELVLYEASLLVEAGVHKRLDGLIVVDASPEQQLARTRLRDDLSEPEIRSRMAAQWPLSEKVRLADYVVPNRGSLAETRASIEAIWKDLQSGGPHRKGPSSP